MQFYDATNKSGICQEIDRLCDTTDTEYSRLAKTSRVNQAMEELVGEIINADGTWQYDDTNYTTLPVGTGTLVEGQESYSFASEYLEIDEVDILDTSGVYRKIRPLDPEEIGDISLEEYFGSTTSVTKKGFPEYYDKVGDSIKLYPAPTSTAVTLTNGLRVRFKRAPQAFTATSATTADTTEPGLPSSYHIILAYMAAIPYCTTYKPDRVAAYEKKVGSNDPTSPVYGGLKKNLIKAYSQRERDKRKIITTKFTPFR